MKKIILILLIILSKVIYSQSITKQIETINTFVHKYNNLDSIVLVEGGQTYNINLFPGQVFSGWYYYSANGAAANLSESPNVNWLSLSPNQFTSTSCSNIIPVSFNFIAPSTPGLYTTTIVDLNNNWGAFPINLTVTENPTINSYDSTVILSINEIANRYQNSSYTPFPNIGCTSSYYPANSTFVTHTLRPNVNWLNINPSTYSVNINSSLTVTKTFNSSVSGTFVTQEIRSKQYYNLPVFIKWHLIVTPLDIRLISNELPNNFYLEQNYPNPFNPFTYFKYSIPKSTFVTLKIYNIMGELVQTLIEKNQLLGTYQIDFDASNLASGIYFYRLETPEFSESKKFMLVK